MTRLLAAVLLLCFFGSGCAAGYRHAVYADTDVRDDGESVRISGPEDSVHAAFVLDFRYFRLLTPVEIAVQRPKFVDDDGGRDASIIVAEQRYTRLDVPLVSFWNFDADGPGFGYPGTMPYRHSLELWLGAETQFRVNPEAWVDLGITYYRSHGIALRLYGGYGNYPYRGATLPPGSAFARVFEGRTNVWGGGLELTFTAGEHALAALKWLLDLDKRHRERSRRRRQ